MRVTQQLSVFLDNTPGALAAVCDDLHAHAINIAAINVENLIDHAVARLVVSDWRGAMHVIGERGTLVIASDVIAVQVSDRPGAIAAVADRLGRAKINIDYLYGSSGARPGSRATLYLRVAEPAEALRALKRSTRATRRPSTARRSAARRVPSRRTRHRPSR